jgi:AcrR family transcriptional regulator
MKQDQIKEPKERIIAAAATLFAEKGYAAIGVREIAKAADVNISMISYYFNGKVGILKSIIEDFFSEYKSIAIRLGNEIFPNRDNNCEISLIEKEKFIKLFVSDMVNLIRRKTDICKVSVLEFPFSINEVKEIKTKMLQQQFDLFKEEFVYLHKKHKATIDIIVGPALLSMIFSNFLMGDIVKSLTSREFDDEFYDEYNDIISIMILGSMKNLNERTKISKTNNAENKFKK